MMSEKSILKRLSSVAILVWWTKDVHNKNAEVNLRICVHLRITSPVIQLTLDGRDRSGWSCHRWRHGSDSRPICLCWWAGREWGESDLQLQTHAWLKKIMLWWWCWRFRGNQPPSSNNHQTSMVPLPCFFLNCWLLSSSRCSVGLRGDLDSVNSVTWHSVRASQLCYMVILVSLYQTEELSITSDDQRAALVAVDFWRAGVRVRVLS